MDISEESNDTTATTEDSPNEKEVSPEERRAETYQKQQQQQETSTDSESSEQQPPHPESNDSAESSKNSETSFNDFQYWRDPLPSVDLNEVSVSSGGPSEASSDQAVVDCLTGPIRSTGGDKGSGPEIGGAAEEDVTQEEGEDEDMCIDALHESGKWFYFFLHQESITIYAIPFPSFMP